MVAACAPVHGANLQDIRVRGDFLLLAGSSAPIQGGVHKVFAIRMSMEE